MTTEELYENSFRRAIQMLESGEDHKIILTYLAEAAEAASPGTVASILLIDKDGFRFGEIS